MAEQGKRQTRSRTIEYQFDDLGRVVNRDEVQQALLDFESVLAALGGMLGVGAIRAVGPNDEYLTIGVKIEWASFAPSVGRLPDREPPTPEPEPHVEEPDMADAMERAEEAAVPEPELKPVA